ncbi:hypothetical protein [Streptomyces sp. TR06-5]|uniref:Rv1733c family protein n=1 Tax=unclassified Streptomyces TaxID=2593676 RepID=UPI0039A11C0C
MAPTPRVRLWRWRANPLRRTSDRVEAWVVLLALLLSTLGGLAVAVLTWTATTDAAREQRAERQRVPAVLLDDADRERREALHQAYQAPNAEVTRVPIRWTAPDGSVRRGTTEVADGSRAGTSVPVWIAPDGEQTAPPGGPVVSQVEAALCAALAAGAFVAPVGAGRAGVRSRLDRQRAEAWERAWARVEPEWRNRAR